MAKRSKNPWRHALRNIRLQFTPAGSIVTMERSYWSWKERKTFTKTAVYHPSLASLKRLARVAEERYIDIFEAEYRGSPYISLSHNGWEAWD